MKKSRDWLQQLLGRLFQPISRRQALQIAAQAVARPAVVGEFVCHDTKPPTCHIYLTTSEPCWYIFVPWGDNADGLVLRSSRVILVGKLTGMIHYDGSAGGD